MTGTKTRPTGGRLVLLAALCLGFAGCAGESDKWWDLVTGVPGEALGFEDRWVASGSGRGGMAVAAHVQSVDLARLDFSLPGGGYAVVHNHGRTVQVHPDRWEEVAVDRTLFLTYQIPFLGRKRLVRMLTELGIDTEAVARDVSWEGHRCIVIGASGGTQPDVPAIYFDQETGAVLRLVTVTPSRIGTRVGDFRLFDHEQRAGAYLPKRFERWNSLGRRSRMERTAAREGVDHPTALFQMPTAPQAASEL